MFEIDVKGLAQLEGGKPSWRLAVEPVANVFDEFRGYDPDRRKPSFCAVSLEHSNNPRGVWMTVADDGAGFDNPNDIWTLFGPTAKRATAGVSGRFNAGDKQLIAVAREAHISTKSITVSFVRGERKVTKHRNGIVVSGTIVKVLMPWSKADLVEVRGKLFQLIPPDGLNFTVNGKIPDCTPIKHTAIVSLPTVLLDDGLLRPTTRKTEVRVLEDETPTLYELGIPICNLADIGFPWSLDVQQKIPVPLSRDSVSMSWLCRAIGSVLEQAAMDGVEMLAEEDQAAGFVRRSLDWIREPDALKAIAKSLYGDDAVRVSSDPIANAQASLAGAPLVSGRSFSADTRRRMDEANIIPTSPKVFGGSGKLREENEATNRDTMACPFCAGTGRAAK